MFIVASVKLNAMLYNIRMLASTLLPDFPSSPVNAESQLTHGHGLCCHWVGRGLAPYAFQRHALKFLQTKKLLIGEAEVIYLILSTGSCEF